ncbi:hypothetical protein OC842_005125 [Tilletia horrida]|uniref:Cytochrome b561 domain-containing protein n=1 Tax=Tilletia horrida TaxID=155126 RepID=A0AAN6JJ95_9BASI|nr:hypothetical protein OC842_005125 [Tilletia horrida]
MATSAALNKSGVSVADAPHRDLSQFRTWAFLLHAVLMIVTFLGIFASGILFGRFGRTFLPNSWFRKHRAIQTAGVLTMVVAAVFAIIGVQIAGIPHFSRPHQQLGLIIIVLVLLQAIGGQAGHVIRQKYGHRAQNAFHVVGGIAIFVLGAINVQRGLKDWGWKPDPRWGSWLLGWSILLGLVFVAGLGLVPAQRREELDRVAAEERAPLLR